MRALRSAGLALGLLVLGFVAVVLGLYGLVLALGRVGSFMSNGSGDFVIAFSTANRRSDRGNGAVETLRDLRNDAVSPLFLAAVESVEEAIYNSLLRAETVTGHRGTVESIPVDRLREVLAGRWTP